MSKFCSICDGRSFEDFNGRPDARCQKCGSLERHRALALFLLFSPVRKGAGACVLNRGGSLPAFYQHLSKLHGDFEAVEGKDQPPTDKKYHTIIHDHLLHGSNKFFGVDTYRDLITRTETMLEKGGVQVFIVGNAAELPRLLNIAYADDVEKSRHVFAPTHFDEAMPEGEVTLFSPFRLFGDEISTQTELGHSAQQPLNGTSVLFRVKA